METPSVFRKHGPKLGRGEKDRISQPLFPVILRSPSDQKPASMEAWLTQSSEIIFLEHMAGQRMDEIYVKNVFYLVHYTQNIIMSTLSDINIIMTIFSILWYSVFESGMCFIFPVHPSSDQPHFLGLLAICGQCLAHWRV